MYSVSTGESSSLLHVSGVVSVRGYLASYLGLPLPPYYGNDIDDSSAQTLPNIGSIVAHQVA